jgi:hypothetical protein
MARVSNAFVELNAKSNPTISAIIGERILFSCERCSRVSANTAAMHFNRNRTRSVSALSVARLDLGITRIDPTLLQEYGAIALRTRSRIADDGW